ncbi:MAG: serine hydrolase domain-containing protein [Planctomycetota bacterium]
MRNAFHQVGLALAAALLAASPTAQQEPRALAEAFAAEHQVPGLSVAIGRRGGEVEAFGLGLADVENDVPATADTVYRLASISKIVTAVAVLQQVEAGALDLDRDVRGYVAAFPEKRWPVTLRQLLGHLGGVRHYRRGEGESTAPFATQAEGLVRFADDDLLHEPGTQYRYSTYGFNLAAAAAEAAAGVPYATWVREHIAAPAGAPTMQDDAIARIIRHRAQGYVRRDGELQNSQLMDASYKLGGGGLCSSAPDLARFGLALMAGKLIGADSLTAMTTAQATRDGKSTGYGMGIGVATGADGRREWSHSGAQARVSTALLLRPDDGIAVAVLCNLEGVRAMPLARAIADGARAR